MAYAPAGNLTSHPGLVHLASVYYDRTALSELRKQWMFWKGVDSKVMPLKNGKTIQFYRYSQLGANTTPTSEGTVGTSLLMPDSSIVSATVSQYSDFISLSDMLIDTAIDGDIVAKAADQLGYRAGNSVDNIIRAEVDSVAGSIDVPLLGDYMSSGDLANVAVRFAGLDIRPKSNGFFTCLMHPYNVYDLVHDPQVGGFKDVTKQTGDMSQYNMLADTGLVGRINDCEVWKTTNTTVTAGTPNLYRSYFFGQEALGAIDLAGRGPTRTMDQNKNRFKVNVMRDGKSFANPEGKIGAMASYNFVFVAKLLDANPYRVRKIDAPTSLGL